MQKFLIPIKPNKFICRANLLRKVHSSLLQNTKLVFIKAPGGYGKTYFMVDIATQVLENNDEVVWLTCSSDDNTAEYFFINLLTQLKKQNIISEDIFYDENISFLRFINRLFEQFEHLKKQLYIFFDDVHCINNSLVIDFIQQLSLQTSNNVKVAIASRIKAPFNLAKGLLNHTVIQVNQSELSFTPEEIEEISKQSDISQLTTNEIEQVIEYTGGWPAIVSTSVLVSDWRVKSPNWNDKSSQANVNLAEYFYQEILSSFSEEDKNNLISLSISDYLCDDLIESLIAKKEFFTQINDVVPLVRLNDPLLTKGLQWFSIHPLMREFLKDQLLESKHIDYKDLHCRASAWFLEQGVFIEATEHLVLAKEYDKAANVISKYGIDIVASGNFPRFKSLTKKLPYSIVTSNPYILVLVGWSYILSYQIKNAEDVIQMMEKMVIKEPELADSFTSLIVALKSAVGLFTDNLLVCESDIVNELAKSPLSVPYAENSLRAELCLLSLHTNDFDKLASLVNEAQFFTEGGRFFYSTLIIRFSEAMMEFSQANFERCIEICDELDLYLESREHQSQLYFVIFIIRGMVEYVTGNLSSADAYFAKSDHLISYVADPSILTWYYPLKLQLLTDSKKFDEKERSIELFMEIVKSRDLILTKQPLIYEVLEHNLELGHRDDAKSLYNQFKEESELCTINLESAHVLSNEQFLDAIMLCDKNQYEPAKEIMINQIKLLENQGRMLQQVRALIILVNIYIENEEVSLAKVTLKKAVAIASTKNIIQFFARLNVIAIGYLQDWSATELSPLRKEFIIAICERFEGKGIDKEASSFNIEELTVKEQSVMELLGQGKSNQQIADELFLSINTVKSHLKVAYKKLGVSNRIQAAKLFTKINFNG